MKEKIPGLLVFVLLASLIVMPGCCGVVDLSFKQAEDEYMEYRIYTLFPGVLEIIREGQDDALAFSENKFNC